MAPQDPATVDDDFTVDKYSLGEGDSRDDEEELWKAFFVKLQPVREAVEGARGAFRNGPIGGALDTFGQLVDDAADIANSFSRRLTELSYSAILRSPGILVALLLLVTAVVGQYATQFQQQIDGDLEIYLPDNADSTELLIEVREDWSTDVVMIYMQTHNAIHDSSQRTDENITSVDGLKQMSWIEGDDSSPGGIYQRGLDWDKSDRGLNDGVIWVLSPAQVIKEANSSSWRFNCAMEKYGLPTSDDESCTIASLNPYYGYEIPDEQDRVDEFIEIAGSLIYSMVSYSNKDGIWDTGVIVMGITFDMSSTDIPPRFDPKLGPVQDHKAFLEFTEELVHGSTSVEFCDLCHVTYERTSTMDPIRLDDIPPRRAVTVTGITPVLHDISDEIYVQLVETMLPASLALVALAMIILHRNAKVLVICGLPIGMSLLITFGTTVIADITLTPMIISAGPILVGLGVDYSLHLTNRIEENRVELIEEGVENAWRQQRDGQETDSIDPWDPLISLTATVRAAMTTGHAIFLSAVTTIIGFSVLTWDSLVPIEPMRTVGTTLLLGISVTFVLSMLMVPALVQLLRYRRGTEVMEMSPMQTVYVALALGSLAAIALYYTDLMSMTNSLILSSMLTVTIVIGSLDSVWEYVGEIPVKATIIVLLVGSVATIAGAIIFEDQMGQGITGGSDQVPPGIESYEALREYSYEFGGGQTNLFIVNATARGPENGTAPIRDLPVLDSLEEIQAKIDNVERTNTTSLVNILKAIHVEIGVDAIDRSLWDMLHSPCWDDPLQLECISSGDVVFTTATSREDMVNVAFDTLSPEVRSMLMNAG